MICQYALDPDNKIVFVDDVANGLKCNCTCISCGERMVAKNGGRKRDHHFSHESGHDCGGYRETLLHIWSKQIVEENKALAIPRYDGKEGGRLLLGPYTDKRFGLPDRLLHFSEVEIEQRNDFNDFQPDIVGVTEDGLRLWIEIFVTHKCSESKISMIKEHGINCIEIKIPDYIETQENLKKFLFSTAGSEYKCYINYPYGETIIQKNKREFYNALKSKCRQVAIEDCYNCYSSFVIQKDYNKLLEQYRGRIPASYNYIFRYKRFKDLANKYPKLEYLSTALSYKKRYNHIDNELSFAIKLSNLFKDVPYGNPHASHWNCSHIIAISAKDEKEFVFCDGQEPQLELDLS